MFAGRYHSSLSLSNLASTFWGSVASCKLVWHNSDSHSGKELEVEVELIWPACQIIIIAAVVFLAALVIGEAAAAHQAQEKNAKSSLLFSSQPSNSLCLTSSSSSSSSSPQVAG